MRVLAYIRGTWYMYRGHRLVLSMIPSARNCSVRESTTMNKDG